MFKTGTDQVQCKDKTQRIPPCQRHMQRMSENIHATIVQIHIKVRCIPRENISQL